MKKLTEQMQLAIARQRQKEIQAKRRPLEESGYIPSQYGKVTRQERLIDNGHLMKSAALANQSYKREQNRAAKKGQKTVVIRIEK